MSQRHCDDVSVVARNRSVRCRDTYPSDRSEYNLWLFNVDGQIEVAGRPARTVSAATALHFRMSSGVFDVTNIRALGCVATWYVLLQNGVYNYLCLYFAAAAIYRIGYNCFVGVAVLFGSSVVCDV